MTTTLACSTTVTPHVPLIEAPKVYDDHWSWFDHKAPDYQRAFQQRANMLANFRALDARGRAGAMQYYKFNPIAFINDWALTSDPRNAANNTIVTLPFILFDRQREFVEWVYTRWQGGEAGICDKSRDVGMSWLCVAIAAHIALFYDDTVIGFGSRKEEYVDQTDSPKSLFWKLRQLLKGLPEEFRGGYVERRDSAHMRLRIPFTRAYINGEAGDNIGRGDRTTITFVDESAFLMRPQLIDAALSATTNCRIDVSSVNGMDNPFAEKRHSWPDYKCFTFHWRQDPRKDDAWYAAKCAELSPIVVAQEIDLDYMASREGVLIPAAWINAAVDLHKRIDIPGITTGQRFAAYDVADKGNDANALTIRQGRVLYYVSAWSGKGSTIYKSVMRVAGVLEAARCMQCDYDSDGLGAGVAGDAEAINDERKAAGKPEIRFNAFHGGGSTVDPDAPVIVTATSKGNKERTNKDFFENAKAQGWWNLRLMFEHSYRASIGENYNPQMVIALDKTSIGAKNIGRLIVELNQPTFTTNKSGKIVIEKAPEGSKSPNLGDSTMINYAPSKRRVAFFG